jgi:hypothetical protein
VDEDDDGRASVKKGKREKANGSIVPVEVE